MTQDQRLTKQLKWRDWLIRLHQITYMDCDRFESNFGIDWSRSDRVTHLQGPANPNCPSNITNLTVVNQLTLIDGFTFYQVASSYV